MIGNGAPFAGGRYWVRTSDPSLVRSQDRLSSGPDLEQLNAAPTYGKQPGHG